MFLAKKNQMEVANVNQWSFRGCYQITKIDFDTTFYA